MSIIKWLIDVMNFGYTHAQNEWIKSYNDAIEAWGNEDTKEFNPDERLKPSPKPKHRPKRNPSKPK